MSFNMLVNHNSACSSKMNIYLAWFLIFNIIMFLALSVSLPVLSSSSGCSTITTCDPFLPVCASSTNEHQFFYSNCEMLRDACLTGKDWKPDYFNHCNVSKL
ncbi:uncharacterized protein LOC26535833 [Drosophila yakuba]|uniref:Kazal-like domain-containing protein n=1 Tax=Drosophila yakuba TaxID=7245 RepID=A0A0R1DU11_DROYA|nr:uncharacterized protein LOC26535833 [Drosophila yakuba]KRK00667.1 uncharacterized protein Dyak_GE28652 [Drosophila yakuba]